MGGGEEIVKELIYSFFQGGMIEPLWYFPAIIVGLYLFKILYKKNSLKYLWMVSVPSYISLILSDTLHIKALLENANHYFYLFYGNYNSFICGTLGCSLLYLTIGSYIAVGKINKVKIKVSFAFSLFILFVVIVLFHIEMVLSLNSGLWNGGRGSYFMLPLLIYCLMRILSNFPDLFRSSFLERYQCSSGIYFIHGLYLCYVQFFFKSLHIPLNSVVYTLIVIVLSWSSIILIKSSNCRIGNFINKYI